MECVHAEVLGWGDVYLLGLSVSGWWSEFLTSVRVLINIKKYYHQTIITVTDDIKCHQRFSVKNVNHFVQKVSNFIYIV